ncbi:endospore germination permease [Paenibacillus frigoriresistens]|uniref:GerAB/ArcD/ProY family transporter n=1 Tax=Paenibacillus alginolyticus TaxID=59839 RepID=UPI00156511AF|nr:endospore germination permease [Paenibacillus frigoriresistens]NRF96283.1 endospore germination permease [Paenibacillus frigoriresistens]
MRRVTQLQVYMLFSQFLFSSTIGFFISPIVQNAGYMVWVSVILGSSFGLVIAYLAYRLCLKRPNRSLAQYGPEILGRWIHYPLISFVIFINLFTAAFILRELEEFMEKIYLPGTPDWAITILFVICVARGVRSGVITIFRSAQGLFFFSVVTVIVFPLFVSNEINVNMAVAFITNFSLPGIWNGIVMVTALFGEMAFIVYFFPYFAQQDKMMKTLGWATATAVVIILTDIIFTILLFGTELTANLNYPTLELIRFNRMSIFLENLDPLLIVFWLYSMLIKISLFLLTSVTALTHTFRLKDHKPLTNVMAALMAGLSLYMFQHSAKLKEMTNHTETAFILFTDLIPTLYLIVDWVRSSRKKNLN